MRETPSSRRTRRSAGRIRSWPVASLPHPGFVAQPPRQRPPPPQRGPYQVLAGGVAAAPGAVDHPVVDAAAAVGARTVELVIVAPSLVAAPPGAVGHGVFQPAAATPIAPRVIAEPFGCLERHLAGGPLLVDVGAAPGAEPVGVRYHPPAFVALRPGDLTGVSPHLRAAAVRAIVPVALKLMAADASELGPRDRLPPPTVVAHSAGSLGPPSDSWSPLAPPAERGGAPVNQVRGLEDRAAPGARLAAPPIDVKRELKPPPPGPRQQKVVARPSIRCVVWRIVPPRVHGWPPLP